jgi:hypothetical protein
LSRAGPSYTAGETHIKTPQKREGKRTNHNSIFFLAFALLFVVLGAQMSMLRMANMNGRLQIAIRHQEKTLPWKHNSP